MKKISVKGILLFLVFFMVTFVITSYNQSSNTGVASSASESVTSLRIPNDFDWSKLTYYEDYRINTKTKEKVEFLNSRIQLPSSIERLPLKPCAEFTDAEKMLAYGVKNIETGVVGDGVSMILMNYRKYFREHKRAPENIYQLPDYAMLKNPKTRAEYYQFLKAYPEAVAAVFSPVAKEPYTFNNKEFTKGQLYITQITDKEWLKKEGKSCGENVTPEEYLKEKEKGFDTTNIVNLYYRVYGEDKTIAEGYVEFSLND